MYEVLFVQGPFWDVCEFWGQSEAEELFQLFPRAAGHVRVVTVLRRHEGVQRTQSSELKIGSSEHWFLHNELWKMYLAKYHRRVSRMRMHQRSLLWNSFLGSRSLEETTFLCFNFTSNPAKLLTNICVQSINFSQRVTLKKKNVKNLQKIKTYHFWFDKKMTTF